MAHIPKWSSELSVRNAQLDEHHIIMFELSKEVIALVKSGSSNNEPILKLLIEFANYAKRHDELEEGLLAANHCPTLEEHKKIHRSAEAELAHWIEAASAPLMDRNALVAYFENLMEHHLAETDIPVKEYMHQSLL